MSCVHLLGLLLNLKLLDYYCLGNEISLIIRIVRGLRFLDFKLIFCNNAFSFWSHTFTGGHPRKIEHRGAKKRNGDPRTLTCYSAGVVASEVLIWCCMSVSGCGGLHGTRSKGYFRFPTGQSSMSHFQKCETVC